MNTTLTDVLATVMDATEVMKDYYDGKTGKDATLAKLDELGAMDWVECSSPWDEYGDYLCKCCIAETIENLT